MPSVDVAELHNRVAGIWLRAAVCFCISFAVFMAIFGKLEAEKNPKPGLGIGIALILAKLGLNVASAILGVLAVAELSVRYAPGVNGRVAAFIGIIGGLYACAISLQVASNLVRAALGKPKIPLQFVRHSKPRRSKK